MDVGQRRGGPAPGTMSFRYGPLRTLERAQERARKAEARRQAKRELSGLPPTLTELFAMLTRRLLTSTEHCACAVCYSYCTTHPRPFNIPLHATTTNAT